MEKLTLGEIYTYAKTSTSYAAFMAELGKWLDIPPTDARCNDITLQDLCNKQLDEYLKNKYQIKRGTSQKNCNKAIRSRQLFKEGYLFAISERGKDISSEPPTKALPLHGVVFSETDNLKRIGTFCEKCREVVCKCENTSEADVCKCLLCYPMITADGYVAKKCINCGIEHLHT